MDLSLDREEADNGGMRQQKRTANEMRRGTIKTGWSNPNEGISESPQQLDIY